MHTLFQGATALAAVAALLFTARSLDYTADATTATRDQVRLAERAQITDRFSRAIDQLGQEGDDKLSIRLGGIYALEHVMRDSPADEPTVIEVLSAFIRTHAHRPAPPASARRPKPPPGPPVRMSLSSPPDVQAAVVVLARRPNPEAVENLRLDLSNTLLGLPKAYLSYANLYNTDLRDANLGGADLSFADLRSADLGGANLYTSDLFGTNLSGANLIGADLRYANLIGADLLTANLSGADLRGALLSGVSVVGEQMGTTDLRGAILTYADLRGVDLAEVHGMTSAQLAGARMDENTRLPDGVVRPSPTPTR